MILVISGTRKHFSGGICECLYSLMYSTGGMKHNTLTFLFRNVWGPSALEEEEHQGIRGPNDMDTLAAQRAARRAAPSRTASPNP